MITFVRAHGYDPGPTQRPLLAGAIAGVLACAPAGLTLVGFGSFGIAAHRVMRLPASAAGAVMLGAFVVAGVGYGALFRRGANDRRAGWLLGLCYGFVLWIVAPVAVLPLLRASAMAAGSAAIGFALAFLLWGLAVGALFPYVHRPLHARLDGAVHRFGPAAGALKRRLPQDQAKT